MTRIKVTTLSNLAFSSSTAKNIAMIAEREKMGTHCLMGVSTRPAWHSEFYAWLFLLWPRLIQNSCWINLKGGAFWENLSSVVTSLDSWKTNWEIKKRTFLLAIRGINVNIVTTTEILIPVQAFLKAFIASYFLFLGDIQCWPNKTQRFYFHQG